VRRPADLNQLAASIVADATNEESNLSDPYGGKDPLAVKLGHRGGLKGGRARAEKLTAEERSNIARKAAAARWGHTPPVTGHVYFVSISAVGPAASELDSDDMTERIARACAEHPRISDLSATLDDDPDFWEWTMHARADDQPRALTQAMQALAAATCGQTWHFALASTWIQHGSTE
jgi:hypothetical protein